MNGERVEIVAAKSMGKRLDAYLADRFRQYSRAYFQKLLREGHILVDDRPAKPSHKVEKGERITVQFVTLPSKLAGEEMPLDILYEDDYLIVINKPVDTVVHPTAAHQRGTIINALIYHCQKLSAIGSPTRPGIIHRLDKDTTGVLLVAKDDVAHIALAKQFHDRKVEKHYLAIVEGEPEMDSDEVSIPLGRHPRFKERMSVRPEEGKESVSVYRVLERFRGFSLVEVQPKTGRTHQIRAQMAWIGHPVVCDRLYGRRRTFFLSELTKGTAPDPGEAPLMDRQALHAYRLGFTHPATGEWTEFQAPIPDDMERLLDALRTYRSNP